MEKFEIFRSLIFANFSSRPATSFLWFTSPWKSLRYIIWNNYKWYILGGLVLLLIIAMIGLFIYSAPVSLLDKFLSIPNPGSSNRKHSLSFLLTMIRFDNYPIQFYDRKFWLWDMIEWIFLFNFREIHCMVFQGALSTKLIAKLWRYSY